MPADSRPGRAAAAHGARRTVLILLALSLLTFCFGLGRQAMTDSDEGFYAEAAREMVASGDWLTPHFNYAQRWEKPILYYWLSASTFAAFGPGEGAARFWSALSGVGLVLLTWAAARRATEPSSQAATEGSTESPAGASPADNRSAVLAGAIVATCFGYYAIARLALPDLPLTFFISLTIWATLRAVDTVDTLDAGVETGGGRGNASHWWMVAGLAAGLGFLTKGPVALVLPVIVLLPIWWHERRRVTVSLRGALIAAAVAAVIGLPWYVAMVIEHGSAYVRSFFLGDNLERFATATYNEPRPFWFYLPIVIGGLMPWSAYLVALPVRPTLNVLRRRRRITPGEWRLLAWAVLPLLFYTASIGKQPRYVLPVLPPLSILLARSMIARIQEASTTQHATAMRIATWVTAGLFVVLTVLLVRAQPLFINAYAPMTWLGVGAIAASAVALGWIALAGAWNHLPSVMTASSVLLLLTTQFGALAGVRPEPVERMAALVAAHRDRAQPVGEYQVFVRNLVFYLEFQQTRLDDQAATVRFVTSAQPVLLVVRQRDLAAIEAGAGRSLRRLAEVRYLNSANLKVGTLLWPDPANDIDTVLLVTNRAE